MLCGLELVPKKDIFILIQKIRHSGRVLQYLWSKNTYIFNISTLESENAKGHISRESIVYEMAHQVRDIRTRSG